MKNIVACIDGSIASTAVCDASAWASQQLNAQVTLLHVLDKSEYPPIAGDFSGAIGLGSRERLLMELADLDEKRGALALKHGKYLLEAAQKQLEKKGVENIAKYQRHGCLVETLLELESETELLIMGKQGEDHKDLPHLLGSHLENVIRTVCRPTLIVLPGFTPPKQFMIAFDGSFTAKKVLEIVIGSPLFKGLSCHVVMIDHASGDTMELDSACEKLIYAGFDVIKEKLTGQVPTALQAYKNQHNIDLMVMGAYGHSRIRQFLVGSNTTQVLSSSDIPLLLFR